MKTPIICGVDGDFSMLLC